MRILSSYVNEVMNSWKSDWAVKGFRSHFYLTIFLFCSVLFFSCLFLSLWETRNGLVIFDPVLSRLHPREFSLPIFALVHSSMLITLILFLKNPRLLLKGLQAYALLLSLRTISIYLVPLEAPRGMIFLQDPITAFFLNSINTVTKDLFFSGHISAMCLFIYFSENKIWKTYLSIITPIVATLILWQHVHYTIDILAAPVFTYFSCKLIERINERWEHGIDNIEMSKMEVATSES